VSRRKIDGQASPREAQEMRDAQFAMRISILFGVAMLLGKTAAFFMTHSVAIFSDAAESVIHVIALDSPATAFALAPDRLHRIFSTVMSESLSSPRVLKGP